MLRGEAPVPLRRDVLGRLGSLPRLLGNAVADALAGCGVGQADDGVIARVVIGDDVPRHADDGRGDAFRAPALSEPPHPRSRILGRRSSDIAEILGFRGREELIHRDDLVLS